MTSYKVLTLTQPYATLIAIGAKHIETRSWATSYRGPLLIHAAAGLGPVGGPNGLRALCVSEFFYSALYAHINKASELPRGAIVAVCRVCAVTKIERLTESNNYSLVYGRSAWVGMSATHLLRHQERAFGDYSAGRYAWLLVDVRALPEPIPAKGALGLWTWEGELPI